MDNEYRFITIHTLVDIGDGLTALTDADGNITTTANLSRIVDTVLRFSYPFMTTVLNSDVDLSKNKNKIYYRLGSTWDKHQTVFTFKFAVNTTEDICADIRKSLDSVPVVISNDGIDRFRTTGDMKNTTIIENRIE